MRAVMMAVVGPILICNAFMMRPSSFGLSFGRGTYRNDRSDLQSRPAVSKSATAFPGDETSFSVPPAVKLQSKYLDGELLPYIMYRVQWRPVGPSRYTKELKERIQQEGSNTKPILVFGESGTRKTWIAALIHEQSKPSQPALVVPAYEIMADPTVLFGGVGGQGGIDGCGRGILNFVEGHTGFSLIVTNADTLPPTIVAALKDLVVSGQYIPWVRGMIPDLTASPHKVSLRLILTSERDKIPELADVLERPIKSVPLRVRKSDIEPEARYYLESFCTSRNQRVPQLSKNALTSLDAYDYGDNSKELQSIVERAVVHAGMNATELDRETIWPSKWEDNLQRFRWNLLDNYPMLGNLVRSEWWPDKINWGFTFWVFPIVVAGLFVGPQDRDHNIFLNVFWAWWWPVIMVSFPLLGRIWCAFCPFMIYGEWAQRLREGYSHVLGPLKKWPREKLEVVGPWFIYGLFAVILLWEELWDLPNAAALSSWLLLLITAGAVTCSVVFERRLWCRYLCPIGGMNGLYAKLSVTDIRGNRGTCSANCNTYHCYKGGPLEEGTGQFLGQETNGCPLYTHPAQMVDSRNCVNCMTCVKACPHGSVGFYVRPPAYDIATGAHEGSVPEVALLFLLLGNVFMRRLPEASSLLHIDLVSAFSTHAAATIAAVIFPLGFAAAVHHFFQQPVLQDTETAQEGEGVVQRQSLGFVELAYGYLPLVWAANLAHWSHLFFTEGGRILPVAAGTIGLDWPWLPSFVMDPNVLAFVQGCVLLFGGGASVVLTLLISHRDIKDLIPQIAGVMGLDLLIALLVVRN